MNVLINYDGNELSVPSEVAEFLETDFRRMSSLFRKDRRYLSKSSFEMVSAFKEWNDETLVEEHDKVINEEGVKTQQIDIYYKFVGYINVKF